MKDHGLFLRVQVIIVDERILERCNRYDTGSTYLCESNESCDSTQVSERV